jgi:osmotically-inducible protein OsmY
MIDVMSLCDDRHRGRGRRRCAQHSHGAYIQDMIIESRSDAGTLIADIIDELRVDPRIDATRIAISASDGGTVVINGFVHSYAEKCWSEELVKRVRGVTAVRNELEVRLTIGEYRTDETLLRVVRDVLDALAAMPQDRPQATVRDGWLTLRGFVRWAFQKRLVEQTVRQIAGIRGITNLINVVPPAGAERALELALNSALRRRIPNDCSVDLVADGNRITLRGTVRTCAERDEVIALAWCAPGVAAVEDHLVIEP